MVGRMGRGGAQGDIAGEGGVARYVWGEFGECSVAAEAVSEREGVEGGRYEVAVERKVELEPRTFLGLENVARKLGCRVKDVAEGAIWEFLERESWKLRAVEEISPERERELEAEREREIKKLSGINRALKRLLR